MPNNRKIVGDAGEHFVAFQLARRGVNPALMSVNSKSVDILATIDGSKVVSIQVKASWGRGNSRQWMVGRNKPESAECFFYVFCNIWEDVSKEPVVFIVPSEDVKEKVNWSASVPIFRISDDKMESYRNNWDSIMNYINPDITVP